MQSPFDIAADLDTPVSAYLKLSTFSPRFLLESVEGGERVGRYSFLGFGDSREIALAGDTLRVDGRPRPAPATRQALLSELREALRQAPVPRPLLSDLPFGGGLVGIVGYDLVHRLEKLPPASAVAGPDPELLLCAPRSLLVFDHLTRRVALLHDGDARERLSLRREVIAALSAGRSERRKPLRHEMPRASLSDSEFVDRVRTAQRHIAAGDVYQLVLSVRFEGAADTDPFQVYRALRLLNPSPYMYFLETPGFAVVGSSPEALVKLQGRHASLRPIAGTRPRGTDPARDRAMEEELLADPKEAAEHVMLVDLARNDLGRVAVPGSIVVEPSRAVERYSHVMHLVSGVGGVLAAGVDSVDLFAATFPAGTVVGAPKIRAMELIDEIEPVRRGVYAGTVGYFGHGGDMDHAIAIRTLVFHEGAFAYQAGAGIVADSVPEREYLEILAKSAALHGALKLAEEEL